MQEPLPILLIHGFGGGAWDYHPLTAYLRRKHRSVAFFPFHYKERFGTSSLESISSDLSAYVEEHLSGKKFVVVGFSQGGLIWRLCALNNPSVEEQALSVFTICTPHHGSSLAYFGIRPGVKDLRPGSPVMKALARHTSHVPYYSIYNPIDTVVVPGTSARLKGAQKNLRVFALTHPGTFAARDTLTFIDSTLFGKTAAQ